MEVCVSVRSCSATAPLRTLITDVVIREGAHCTCAAAAMLAMVLRWFIWLIAMVTDAGGRLTGIRGCDIIMKGSSRPVGEDKIRGYEDAAPSEHLLA